MTDPDYAPWFTTTPEAVLRAEQYLLAFAEKRTAHIGTILANQTGRESVDDLVALIAISDRLTDYAATIAEQDQQSIIREAARVVGQAAIQKGSSK